ncbi:hypothetical protein, partial [Tenacibaculum maritimum]|uniref:hypothetical protein n=1 Tax=Tenacibaculum maritimum TaxID=107401 RepID=UPI001F1EAB0E
VLQTLMKNYGYKRGYILKFLRGERKNVVSDEIIKNYHSLRKAAENSVNEKNKEIIQALKK